MGGRILVAGSQALDFWFIPFCGLATECLPSSNTVPSLSHFVMDTVRMDYITVAPQLQPMSAAKQSTSSHMHPSFRVAHKPLISFIGKRLWPPGPQPQRPHPAAPAQLKEAFSDFLEKYKNFSLPSTSSSNGQSSGRPTFNEFWEAPEYLWRPKVRKLEDSEIDAVSSGGASLR